MCKWQKWKQLKVTKLIQENIKFLLLQERNLQMEKWTKQIYIQNFISSIANENKNHFLISTYLG